MPELPEVETVRTGLSKYLPGRQFAVVESTWLKSFPNSEQAIQSFLIGSRVATVTRRAKLLIIGLNSNYSLVIHLKMTGQLVFRVPGGEHFGAGHPSDSLISELPDKSTRVTFTFTDGSKLFFNDQRKFGWVRLLATAEVTDLDFFKRVGPEPLSTDFTWLVLYERLRRRPNTKIKAALLDQTVIAGIGNIYADESLWGAKIHPSTLVKSLSESQIKTLYKELVEVLSLAIEKGGSTDRNYVNAEGKKGNYLTFARVFRREGQVCLRCGTSIIKTRVAGRGTHICPNCQRLNG